MSEEERQQKYQECFRILKRVNELLDEMEQKAVEQGLEKKV